MVFRWYLRKYKTPLILLACILLVVLLVVGNVVYWFTPIPLLSAGTTADQVEVYRVQLCTDSYDVRKDVDLLEQVDCEQIAQLLSRYSRSRRARPFSHYARTTGEVEISFLDAAHTNWHIVLSGSVTEGNPSKAVNVIYSSSQQGAYTIRHSDQLRAELFPLFPAAYAKLE